MPFLEFFLVCLNPVLGSLYVLSLVNCNINTILNVSVGCTLTNSSAKIRNLVVAIILSQHLHLAACLGVATFRGDSTGSGLNTLNFSLLADSCNLLVAT